MAGHERGCSRELERESALLPGYLFCPECSRTIERKESDSED